MLSRKQEQVSKLRSQGRVSNWPKNTHQHAWPQQWPGKHNFARDKDTELFCWLFRISFWNIASPYHCPWSQKLGSVVVKELDLSGVGVCGHISLLTLSSPQQSGSDGWGSGVRSCGLPGSSGSAVVWTTPDKQGKLWLALLFNNIESSDEQEGKLLQKKILWRFGVGVLSLK